MCFARIFALARQEGLDNLADDLLDIPDTCDDILKARLKSENTKWLLSKRKPQVYGERLDLHVNQTVDISTALKEARARTVLPMCDPGTLPKHEVIEITGKAQENKSDVSSDKASEPTPTAEKHGFKLPDIFD